MPAQRRWSSYARLADKLCVSYFLVWLYLACARRHHFAVMHIQPQAVSALPSGHDHPWCTSLDMDVPYNQTHRCILDCTSIQSRSWLAPRQPDGDLKQKILKAPELNDWLTMLMKNMIKMMTAQLSGPFKVVTNESLRTSTLCTLVAAEKQQQIVSINSVMRNLWVN